MKLAIEGKLYSRAIRNLRNCVATDDARPMLQKVMFVSDGKQITFSALDGYQGMKLTVPLATTFASCDAFEGYVDPAIPLPVCPRRSAVPVYVELEQQLDSLDIVYIMPYSYTAKYTISQKEKLTTALDAAMRDYKAARSVLVAPSILYKSLRACSGADFVEIAVGETDEQPLRITATARDEDVKYDGIFLPARKSK